MRINAKKTPAKTLPKPDWLRIRPPAENTPAGKKYVAIRSLIRAQKLHTVCSEAACPNAAECWSSGTATFMILGDTCTRACRFCNVKSGNPHGIVDNNEPQKLVDAVKAMGLKYAVLTCVTRDDLKDGGAGHFADCIRALKKSSSNLKIEVLISDLNGDEKALKKIITARPDVIAHNIETVERLQKEVRDPRANYKKSLSVLREVKKNAKIFTKSAIMLGLGETRAEVIKAMKDLRAVSCDLLTIGQYLQPSPYHLPVKKFVTPAQFKSYETVAKKLGFLYCASGPFVRSSYRAGEMFIRNKCS
jgi:lipoic acid synthetase